MAIFSRLLLSTTYIIFGADELLTVLFPCNRIYYTHFIFGTYLPFIPTNFWLNFFLRSPFLFRFGFFTRVSRHCIFHFQIWYAGVLYMCLRFSKYNAYKMMHMRINAVRKTCATLVVSGVLHSVAPQYFSSALYLSFSPTSLSPPNTRLVSLLECFSFISLNLSLASLMYYSVRLFFISFCWGCCCCYCFWINALFPLSSRSMQNSSLFPTYTACALLFDVGW